MAARTVPTMPDWTSHEVATSALLEQVTTYVRFWANPPMFSMYQTVAQPVPNSALTQITCDTPEWDTDNGRGLVTPWSYTIPAGMSGRWKFNFAVSWAANAAGTRVSVLVKNGVQVIGTNFAGPGGPAGSVNANAGLRTVLCAANDVIGLYGFQSTGGALNTSVGTNTSFFEGRLVSLANP